MSHDILQRLLKIHIAAIEVARSHDVAYRRSPLLGEQLIDRRQALVSWRDPVSKSRIEIVEMRQVPKHFRTRFRVRDAAEELCSSSWSDERPDEGLLLRV